MTSFPESETTRYLTGEPFQVCGKAVTRMSLVCSIAACKAKAGMCTHEKVAAGLIALLVVGLVVAKGLSLF